MKPSYREALLAFIVCAVVTTAIYAAMYFGAPLQAQKHVEGIVATFGDTEGEAFAFLVESARYTSASFIKLLLPMFAVYWLVAGLLCRAPSLHFKIANSLLIFGSLGMIAIAANSYFYWAETYCDVLPYPHEGFQILRIYECPSSQIFFTSLFWLSAALFVLSLVARVVQSRGNTLVPN